MTCTPGHVTLDPASDQYLGSGLAWTIFQQVSYFWNDDREALRAKAPELAAQSKGLATVLCALFDEAAATYEIPVGHCVTAVIGEDPATTLGYGTWEEIGAGRVLVGQDTGDSDFDVLEEEGGTKTHDHSVAAHQHDMPHVHSMSHTHDGPDHSHSISHTHIGPDHRHSHPHTHQGPTHTHSLSNHDHPGPSHTHATGDHTHPITNHSHSLNSHTHEFLHFHHVPWEWSGGVLYWHGDTPSATIQTARLATVSQSGSSGSGYEQLCGSPRASDGTESHDTDGPDPTSTGLWQGTTGSPSASSTGSGGTGDTGPPSPNVTGGGGALTTGGSNPSNTYYAGDEATSGPSVADTGAAGTGATSGPSVADTGSANPDNTEDGGSGNTGSASNYPKYLVVKIWKRVA